MLFSIRTYAADRDVEATSAAERNANKMATPDARDIDTFSSMMEQKSVNMSQSSTSLQQSAMQWGANSLGQNGMPNQHGLNDIFGDEQGQSSLADGAATLAGNGESMEKLMSRMAKTMQNTVHDTSTSKGHDDANMTMATQGTEVNSAPVSLMAGMESVLQNPFLQSPQFITVAETANVHVPHFTAQEIDAMVAMLVDRIAVTDTAAHTVTVEVSLADTALNNTSVHLTRSLDGLLAVNIRTDDAMSFQTLVGAQLDLKARLEALETGTVRVDIFHENQDDEIDGRSGSYDA